MRRFHRCSCQSILNSPLEELKGGWKKITSGPCLNSLLSYWRSDVTFRRLRCFARSKIIMAVNDRYCVFTIFGIEDELWKLGQRETCDQKNNILSGVTLSVKEFKFKHSNRDSNSTVSVSLQFVVRNFKLSYGKSLGTSQAHTWF